MRRFAVIAVISSVLVAGLLVFLYTNGASPSAAARLEVSGGKARHDKLPAATYGRFQVPSVIAPPSL